MAAWEYLVLTWRYVEEVKGLLDITRTWRWTDQPSNSMSVAERLNILGGQEWELVVGIPLDPPGAPNYQGNTTEVKFILKRLAERRQPDPTQLA
jgi:hypothetical protein